MYSKEIQKKLKDLGVEIGDSVRVKRGDQVHEGILMPKQELGDPDAIVIKLSNGYSLGLKFKGSELEKLQGHKGIGFKSSEEKTKRIAGKPLISIISTGGTVASRVDYATGGVDASYRTSDIVKTVPELGEFNIDSKFLFEIMSENMTPEHWKEMARAVYKELKTDTKGVIVTHGTDTMHFSSAALSFMLRDLNKPVVFTGSQRSSDRGSSDSFINMICSANFASKGDVAEVSLVMHGSSNDDFCYAHRGTKVRKLHTSKRDAFKSVNDEPLAKIFPDGRIEMTNGNYRKRCDGEVSLDDKLEEKVALIKTYPGMEPGIFDFYIGKKFKGFVIEGTGLGHVPTIEGHSVISRIREATKAGIPVCITSQCLFGRVHDFVYANLRKEFEAGAMFCGDMLPEVAYVKLMHVLAHSKDLEEIKKMMLTNVAGELNERTPVLE
ncbi:MAG: Glu-tRNA(Gln) amidotransferase subunit GatD [Candidatus Micrarchaeota archaeon]|nr:Glu-tRNA(Gln) amidotransferase subunit GatD [Candidatus Micrarchaeota archaeon]